MPGLVKKHDQAAWLNASAFWQEREAKMASDDVMVLVDAYLVLDFIG